MPEPIAIKLGTYIMAPKPISMANSINPSYQSVHLYVHVPRQRLGKDVTAALNAHATVEFMDVLFYAVRVISSNADD
jgi:hypothetical protein